MDHLALNRRWSVGQQIGQGGFGRVFVVTSGGDEAVAKLVPKEPGAERELLFVDLGGVRNVVPIIDSGETATDWVLVMPRAEKSLREHVGDAGGRLDAAEAVRILSDVAIALADLEGRVVHRDLKPENVLRYQDRWCLADFGISRYAEATTAPDTHKYALTPAYAAPERWRSERATAATDVYAVGIIGYELLSGSLPFSGPQLEDFRDQHLHAEPPPLDQVPTALAALIEECLYKAPGARPSPSNLLARLERFAQTTAGEGLTKLQQAHQAEVVRRAELERGQSHARTEAERRTALAEAAKSQLARISATLRDAITEAAPATTVGAGNPGGLALRLGQAELLVSPFSLTDIAPWGQWEPPAFTVVAHASIEVRVPADRFGYEGRSHSLWFCDAQERDQYGWFETAFMISALIAGLRSQDPFALRPGEESAKALWSGMAEFQLAWPFTRLVVGELEEFVDRWADWFADASQGRLHRPSTIPERSPQGSWRRQ